MKKILAFLVMIMFMPQLALADGKTVSESLKTLCYSGTHADADEPSYKEAQKIFDSMKMYERQACGVRGEDYISFLVKKYQHILNS